MALSGSVLGQNLFSNASFENGTYPTSGAGTTPFAFAGQQAHGAANTGTGTTTTGWTITGWSFASGNNGLSERWINDSAEVSPASDTPVRAQNGNRYAFLSTTTTSGHGNGCLQYTAAGGISFAAGTTYQFSFYAADAGSTSTSGSKAPVIGFEVEGGGGNPSSVLQTTTLPLNPAWSDTAETEIPWLQYTFNWTPTSTYTTPTFYWSVFAGTGASAVGSVVLDNVSVSIVAVPEAHTVAAGVFVAGLAGATWLRRRQSKA